MSGRNKNFSLEDLKSGFVVQLRTGEYRMVMRAGNFTHILVNDKGSWTYLSRWDRDLKRNRLFTHDCYSPYQNETFLPCSDKYDIVRVFGLVQRTSSYSEVLKISPDSRSLLWERNPPVKMTLEEIQQKLGYPIEIVASNN